MEYKAPFFRTVFIDRKVPADPKIKELIFWGKVFSDLSLTPSYGKGSHGNLSFRHLGGCITTATRTFLHRLTPHDFVEVVDCLKDPDGAVLYCRGKKEPSTDAYIHMMIYKNRPDVRSIFHGHDAAVLQTAQKLRLPETQKERESGSVALFQEIKRTLGTQNYIVIKNHGILSFGRTNKEAGERALEMHERALKFVSNFHPGGGKVSTPGVEKKS